MNYIGKFISNFKDFYNEINAATLTGAIDVVVVRQEDGTFLSSPFHVRFGKMGVLRSREKVVDIEINGEPVDIHMKLGETGEAFFVEELEEGVEISPLLGTSPLPESVLSGKHDLMKGEDARHAGDSGVDDMTFPSTDPSKADSKDDSPSSETITAGDVTESTITVQSDGMESENSFANNGKDTSEIGVIKIVRKNNIKREQRDMETQTDRPTLTVVISKKGDVNSALKKGVSSTSLVIEDAGPKRSVLINEGRGSKTDGEETVKNNKSIRRKRKKRYNGKKNRPKSSGSQSSDTSTTSEVADITAVLPESGIAPTTNQDGIFVMDDIESTDKFAPSSCTSTSHMAQSTSMPLLREKSREEVVSEWSGAMSRSMGPDFHPFSDTDLSPPPSPSTSRPPTPIKSDTEYEVERQRADFTDGSSQTDENKWYWTWGELPTPPPKTPTRSGSLSLKSDSAAPNAEKNGKTSKEEGGVKDDDAESGNGPSLPQSPHSVEGAIGCPKLCSDSDFEDSRHPIFDYKGYDDIAFSLCGRLHEYEGDFPESLFLQSIVTYDDFIENPQILDNPNLVIRYGGKYLNWMAASPQILSLVLFQRPVPQKLANQLYKEHMPKKEIRKRSESKGYSWFSWRRNNQAESEEMEKKENNASEKTEGAEIAREMRSTIPVSLSLPILFSTEHMQEAGAPAKQGCSIDPNVIEVTAAETQTSLPGTPKKKGHHDRRPGTDSSESEDQEEMKERQPSGERFKKSLRLTSDQIAKLNLREGSNEALFSVTTAYQGTTRCKCHIFLWNHDAKIVVSDIDGTITKSDVLGHLLPILGKDWAQSGVAQLFTKIKNNGYHFLYLSARAIGQARITRDYLRSIKQGDLSLPDGPLLLNPTSLVQAFHREVIEKKPEEFKISCLRDIQALFAPERNPFYSGYGNRINDVWAYRAVGIPISRIFTINHRGELKHELTQTFQSSYVRQSKVVDEIFPPIEKTMVPRNLINFMYSDSECDESDTSDMFLDDNFDSDWEGFPTGIDLISLGS
ncbi:phosphatidate phosphatase LPIN3-like isoform X5 [Macrobrachium nipponense]|uniref:phosphatidate phosphatase LPIN3-like isoform X5 n=1 Tax=Macrobrachium nipponense TaxID=159736 RepID=UPI0030C866CA